MFNQLRKQIVNRSSYAMKVCLRNYFIILNKLSITSYLNLDFRSLVKLVSRLVEVNVVLT